MEVGAAGGMIPRGEGGGGDLAAALFVAPALVLLVLVPALRPLSAKPHIHILAKESTAIHGSLTLQLERLALEEAFWLLHEFLVQPVVLGVEWVGGVC